MKSKISFRLPVNTTIKQELKEKAWEEDIEFSKALDFGIEFFLAEKGLCEYPDCSMKKKVESLVYQLNTKEESTHACA